MLSIIIRQTFFKDFSEPRKGLWLCKLFNSSIHKSPPKKRLRQKGIAKAKRLRQTLDYSTWRNRRRSEWFCSSENSLEKGDVAGLGLHVGFAVMNDVLLGHRVRR